MNFDKLITIVLLFVPFTMEEKRAIYSGSLHNLGGYDSRSLFPVEKIPAGVLGHGTGRQCDTVSRQVHGEWCVVTAFSMD